MFVIRRIAYADRRSTITSFQSRKRLTTFYAAKLICKHAAVTLIRLSKTPSAIYAEMLFVNRIHLADATESALILRTTFLTTLTEYAGIFSCFNKALSTFRTKLATLFAVVSPVRATVNVLVTILTLRAMQADHHRAFITKTTSFTQRHAIFTITALTAEFPPVSLTFFTAGTRRFLVRRIPHHQFATFFAYFVTDFAKLRAIQTSSTFMTIMHAFLAPAAIRTWFILIHSRMLFMTWQTHFSATVAHCHALCTFSTIYAIIRTILLTFSAIRTGCRIPLSRIIHVASHAHLTAVIADFDAILTAHAPHAIIYP